MSEPETKWEMWRDEPAGATHLRLVVTDATRRSWSTRQNEDLTRAGHLIERAFKQDDEVKDDFDEDYEAMLADAVCRGRAALAEASELRATIAKPRRVAELSPDELRAAFERMGANGAA